MMLRALTLALACCFFAGCSAPTTSSGTEYRFRVNELIATLPYELSAVYAAAERVVREDMRWEVESSSLASASGRIVARGAGDRTRRVSIVATGDASTEVRVEVNDSPLGNSERSLDVLERLEARLAGG